MSKKYFNYTLKNELPTLKKIHDTWDLTRLYYASENDPQFERDIKITEAAYTAFVKKWSKKDFTKDAKTLLKALKENEDLAGLPEASKPGRYLWLRLAIDVNDKTAEETSARLSRRLRKLADSILFFNLRLGKIDKKQQRAFLKDESLKAYHYYLSDVFTAARHNLTEDQEKIINLKSAQAYGRWVDMTEKLLSNTTIIWKKKEVALPEAMESIDVVPFKEKEKLWQLIRGELIRLSSVVEHEFNAIITDVRTEDELREYKKPYSATALAYEDTEENIERLVSVVTKKGFPLSKKFYRLKARLHKKEALSYAERNASYGKMADIPFSEAVEICREVFYELKHEYGVIFDTMLSNGQIDVFPRKGKQGGAFMSGQVGQPTAVFLNHTSTFSSLLTLAHEMGHAIHTERSKVQSPFYQGYSTVCAETASTLFENIVFDAVLEQATDAQKITLLHDRNLRDISTIERQVAFFNTELDIHNTIDKKGAMSKEELADTMNRHMKSYLGDGIDLKPEDGYLVVAVPHLRFGFYVYSYAFGLMMSTVMSSRYKEDKSYIEQIDAFLSSGSTNTVAKLFRQHADIDITDPQVYEKALRTQAANIKALEKMLK